MFIRGVKGELSMELKGFDVDMQMLGVLLGEFDFRSRQVVDERSELYFFDKGTDNGSDAGQLVLSVDNPYFNLSNKGVIDEVRSDELRLMDLQLVSDSLAFSDSVFIVVELKRKGQTIAYETYPVNNELLYDGQRYHQVLLLPIDLTSEYINCYIWNNGQEAFHFTNFTCDLLVLDEN